MPISLTDKTFMSRCFELALKGAGRVSPNPMVGSVIVHEGTVIGEGYHERYGGPHAEVNAINAVMQPELLPHSTLYVNLEPCAHFGKTPPCSDLIISKGIRRVVVGCRDPHVKVAGMGIGKLVDAGIEVAVGVLEERSLKLNEAFIKSHQTGLPFVSLKIAQTLDGKIATASGESKWITGVESRTMVHLMRSRYDAVMAGSSTVKADNAELTVRLCGGRQPLRVVLDRNLELPLDAKVFNSEAVTIVFASDHCDPKKAGMLRKAGVEVYPVPETSGSLDLRRVLLELHRLGVQSVLVEGGSRLSAAFAGSGLADKLYLFVAAKFFGGDGLSALAPIGILHPEEAVRLRIDHSMHYGSDLLIEAYFQ